MFVRSFASFSFSTRLIVEVILQFPFLVVMHQVPWNAKQATTTAVFQYSPCAGPHSFRRSRLGQLVPHSILAHTPRYRRQKGKERDLPPCGVNTLADADDDSGFKSQPLLYCPYVPELGRDVLGKHPRPRRYMRSTNYSKSPLRYPLETLAETEDEG